MQIITLSFLQCSLYEIEESKYVFLYTFYVWLLGMYFFTTVEDILAILFGGISGEFLYIKGSGFHYVDCFIYYANGVTLFACIIA